MVYVFLAEGFEEIEAVTILDVLRRGGVETFSVAVPSGNCEPCEGGCRGVEGAHGIRIRADLAYEEADFEKCEMIVLPGGMPGTSNLAAHTGLREQIKDSASGGGPVRYLAAICAAPMIPGQMGLLEGKKAVIYPGMEGYLKGAVCTGKRVERDGNIMTSQGPGTAMEFAIELIAVLKGKERAEAVRNDLLMK